MSNNRWISYNEYLRINEILGNSVKINIINKILTHKKVNDGLLERVFLGVKESINGCDFLTLGEKEVFINSFIDRYSELSFKERNNIFDSIFLEKFIEMVNQQNFSGLSLVAAIKFLIVSDKINIMSSLMSLIASGYDINRLIKWEDVCAIQIEVLLRNKISFDIIRSDEGLVKYAGVILGDNLLIKRFEYLIKEYIKNKNCVRLLDLKS
jgi:hypothetical protein